MSSPLTTAEKRLAGLVMSNVSYYRRDGLGSTLRERSRLENHAIAVGLAGCALWSAFVVNSSNLAWMPVFGGFVAASAIAVRYLRLEAAWTAALSSIASAVIFSVLYGTGAADVYEQKCFSIGGAIVAILFVRGGFDYISRRIRLMSASISENASSSSRSGSPRLFRSIRTS